MAIARPLGHKLRAHPLAQLGGVLAIPLSLSGCDGILLWGAKNNASAAVSVAKMNANPFFRNNNGKTAIEVAKDSGKNEVVDISIGDSRVNPRRGISAVTQ